MKRKLQHSHYFYSELLTTKDCIVPYFMDSVLIISIFIISYDLIPDLYNDSVSCVSVKIEDFRQKDILSNLLIC